MPRTCSQDDSQEELRIAQARVAALEQELCDAKVRLKDTESTLCKALDEAVWVAAHEATSEWESTEVCSTVVCRCSMVVLGDCHGELSALG